jgi:alpha-glucosidase
MRHVESEPDTAGRQLLYDEPHHDGSSLYLPNPPQALGDSFDVLLRAPYAAGVTRVSVRQVHDGEPFGVPAQIVLEEGGAQWWQATLTQWNPVINYRFLTDSGPYNYRWITAAGPVDHDPSDAGDFRSAVGDPGGPRWLDDAVVYQVFPDRFARSGRVDEELLRAAAQDWATLTPWNEEPAGFGPQRARQLYGGDLYGVAERLDHLSELGVNVLYLTPVFPAPSNHRYNATSFAHVDPILGGDEALAALVDQAHQRGMKVLGDFTTNHTGSRHEWFAAAQADLTSEEAGYYFFGDSPDDYEGWFGVPSLPKVDHRSAALRRRMITDPDSPVRRFLREPFELDGWRVDVANMTARHREHDDNHDVARDFRKATLADRPDAYVVGEHFHDFRDDLPGDGWHGVMNYAGFAKPLLTWLNDEWPAEHWLGLPWPHWPRLPGPSVVATMRDFLSVPWPLLQSSLTLIGSHDTARIRTITGDPDLVEVAVGALMTYPGTPMIWAGDEVGLEGVNGEHGRGAFPWEEPDSWAHDTLHAYRALAQLRRTEPALQVGGLRWLFVDDDRIVFLRETVSQGVLVCLARAPGSPITLPISGLGGHDGHGIETLYGSGSITSEGEWFTIPGAGPAVHILRWNRRTSSRSNSTDTITTTGG